MRRFDLLEGERMISDDEMFATSEMLYGKKPRVLDDFMNIMEYYARSGEKVCCLFSGFLIHSIHLDEIRQAGDEFYKVLDKYSRIEFGPIVSLDEFEREVASLGDFRNPANHIKYIKIMLQVTGLIEKGFDFKTELNNISGRFKGDYPESVTVAIRSILSKYLPKPEVFFDPETGMLRNEFMDENKDFYTYLGYFCSNCENLMSPMRFTVDCQNAGVYYNGPRTIEEVTTLVEQSRPYVEGAPTLE